MQIIVYWGLGHRNGHGRAHGGVDVEGEDLAERLGRRGLSLAQTLAVAERVARALSALHERDIVHANLAPQQIFLVDRQLSHIKLTDFGAARRLGAAVPSVTRTTPEYMAPECVAGLEPPSPQGDIYTLGCVLFECLTGRPPYLGSTLVELFSEVVNARPRASTRSSSGLTAMPTTWSS